MLKIEIDSDSEFLPRLWVVWANTLNFDGVHKSSFALSYSTFKIIPLHGRFYRPSSIFEEKLIEYHQYIDKETFRPI